MKNALVTIRGKEKRTGREAIFAAGGYVAMVEKKGSHVAVLPRSLARSKEENWKLLSLSLSLSLILSKRMI